MNADGTQVSIQALARTLALVIPEKLKVPEIAPAKITELYRSAAEIEDGIHKGKVIAMLIKDFNTKLTSAKDKYDFV